MYKIKYVSVITVCVCEWFDDSVSVWCCYVTDDWQVAGSWFVCRRHWRPALSAWICQWNLPLHRHCHQQRACRHYERSVCCWQGDSSWLWRWVSICRSLQISAFRFAILINSIQFTQWINSVPTKLDCAVWSQLVGVFMQRLPTLTVCTLYAGIIHLVLFNNSVRTVTRRITQLTWANRLCHAVVIHSQLIVSSDNLLHAAPQFVLCLH